MKKLTLILSIASLVFLSSEGVHAQYSLTFLHNNDGESRIINAGRNNEGFGGIARFATLLDDTRGFYSGLGHGVVTISSGDNFLPGPELAASTADGVFYDARAISQMNYDAVILGNHEFDFGPDFLAEFIDEAQTHNATTFLSSNLDFSGEATLSARETAGLIAPSKLVSVSTAAGTKSVGIIGATTENLPFISSPGAVTVSSVADAVNAQIDALKMGGADHIVLASHLQGISEDEALVPLLKAGVDLMIACGGDDRLASPGGISPSAEYGAGAPASIVDTGFVFNQSDPSEVEGAEGPYPTISSASDLGGNSVPIVSTDANYKYLGRVTLDFDSNGDLIGANGSSNPQRVASTTIDMTNGVEPDAFIQENYVDPVSEFVDDLANQMIGTTSQQIVGGGSSDLIRSAERNGGNLVADAVFAKATEIGQTPGGPTDVTPDIALVNGGGIRADIPAGDVTLLDTFNVSRFQNFVSIVEDVTIDDLKLLLENAYSKTVDGPGAGVDPMRQGDGTGRFAHLSGLRVVYDINAPALELDEDGKVLVAGERILDVILEDGTLSGKALVEGGVVVSTETLDIATLNFLALGGDQYFDADYLSQQYSFTNLRVTDQQSVADYISAFGGDLASDFRYDSTPDGRVVAVAIPEPGSAALILISSLLFARRRKS